MDWKISVWVVTLEMPLSKPKFCRWENWGRTKIRASPKLKLLFGTTARFSHKAQTIKHEDQGFEDHLYLLLFCVAIGWKRKQAGTKPKEEKFAAPIDLIPLLCVWHQGKSCKWNNNGKLEKSASLYWGAFLAHDTNTVDFAWRWKQLILAYGYRSLSQKCLL